MKNDPPPADQMPNEGILSSLFLLMVSAFHRNLLI